MTLTGIGRGDFFAIDRRAWAWVSKLGINCMTTYLLLARGTGHDQRTTSWSVNAIETYTGISRPRAQQAINMVSNAGAVRVLRKGSKPRYFIVAAHEIPGCEGYPPPTLDADGQSYSTTSRPGRLLLRPNGTGAGSYSAGRG